MIQSGENNVKLVFLVKILIKLLLNIAQKVLNLENPKE